NNNPQKNFGSAASPFGNSSSVNPSSQQRLGSVFPGQFQLSAAQVQAFAQAQSKAQAQAQVEAAHAQLQAQLQAQGLSFNPGGIISNLGSASPYVSGSGSLGVKKFPQKPPAPQGFFPSNAASPYKKQKLPEKQLRERVAAVLPKSALYTQLLEFESRVDAALTRKKIDIQDALKSPSYVQKTLRVYVFNTFADRAEPPTWTLKIVGRILDEANASYPKFSSFFKRVTITLDQNVYPDDHLIVWDGSRSPAHHEGFEVKRKGDREFTAAIRLEMNYTPEKFKLSPPLAELLGIEVETRGRIMAALWQYIKAWRLSCPDDPSSFNCDLPLQKIFGDRRMKFTAATQRIAPHLHPPQPIRLQHRVKLSGSNPVGTACYDVVVDVPFPIQRELNALLAGTEKPKEIEACDEAISGAIRKIHQHWRRRAFFLGFSQSPVEFVNAMMDSQNNDSRLVSGDEEKEQRKRRSDFYNQPWVEDVVIRYLNRKTSAG
ncbi:chromatin remodeling complex subunit, partial [Genlisea aurea]